MYTPPQVQPPRDCLVRNKRRNQQVLCILPKLRSERDVDDGSWRVKNSFLIYFANEIKSTHFSKVF